jgi:hypothetical protein
MLCQTADPLPTRLRWALIEALNRHLRKAIKTKGHFPNEDSAPKLIYLAIQNAAPDWTRTRNWTIAPPHSRSGSATGSPTPTKP